MDATAWIGQNLILTNMMSPITAVNDKLSIRRVVNRDLFITAVKPNLHIRRVVSRNLPIKAVKPKLRIKRVVKDLSIVDLPFLGKLVGYIDGYGKFEFTLVNDYLKPYLIISLPYSRRIELWQFQSRLGIATIISQGNNSRLLINSHDLQYILFPLFKKHNIFCYKIKIKCAHALFLLDNNRKIFCETSRLAVHDWGLHHDSSWIKYWLIGIKGSEFYNNNLVPPCLKMGCDIYDDYKWHKSGLLM